MHESNRTMAFAAIFRATGRLSVFGEIEVITIIKEGAPGPSEPRGERFQAYFRNTEILGRTEVGS
jgi:hypothetical protein